MPKKSNIGYCGCGRKAFKISQGGGVCKKCFEIEERFTRCGKDIGGMVQIVCGRRAKTDGDKYGQDAHGYSSGKTTNQVAA